MHSERNNEREKENDGTGKAEQLELIQSEENRDEKIKDDMVEGEGM